MEENWGADTILSSGSKKERLMSNTYTVHGCGRRGNGTSLAAKRSFFFWLRTLFCTKTLELVRKLQAKRWVVIVRGEHWNFSCECWQHCRCSRTVSTLLPSFTAVTSHSSQRCCRVLILIEPTLSGWGLSPFAAVEWLKPLPGRIDQVQFK